MTAPGASAKSILREQVRARLKIIAAVERSAFAQQLCALMAAQELWRRAQRILLFSPLPDEPDISLLLDAAWRAGKLLALPRSDPRAGGYVACVVEDRSRLAPVRFGVLEPDADCPVTPLNQLDLVFVPGIAFDLVGRRLGRGKGFYDRLLAGVRGHKCGVAFDTQLVAEVPEEPHDRRVDSIITPTRWHLCPRAA